MLVHRRFDRRHNRRVERLRKVDVPHPRAEPAGQPLDIHDHILCLTQLHMARQRDAIVSAGLFRLGSAAVAERNEFNS